jgi:hypothetical protein
LRGALCPPVNLAPGGGADILGGAPPRVPVWEIAFAFNPSRARGPFFSSSSTWEAVMTPRKQKNYRQPSPPSCSA